MLAKGGRIAINPLLIIAVIAVLATFLVDHFFTLVPALTSLDERSERAVLIQSPRIAASDAILLLESDEDSIAEVSSRTGLRGRILDAHLITLLDKAGARVCYNDLTYEVKEPDEDASLWQAISGLTSMKLVLVNYPAEENGELVFPTLGHVLPKTRNATFGEATVLDSDNDPVFFFPILDLLVEPPVKSAALSAVLYYLGIEEEPEYDVGSNQVIAGSFAYRASIDGTAIFQYTHQRNPFRSIDISSFMMLDSEQRRALVQEKLVIYGKRDPSDLHRTVFGIQPGYLVNAFAVNSLITGAHKRVSWTSARTHLWIAGVFAAIGAALGWIKKSWKRALGVALAVLAAWALPFALVHVNGVLESGSTLAATLLTAFAICAPIAIPATRLKNALSGTTAATALFLDIRKSTELMTQVGAREYGALFDQALEACVEPLRTHHGILERPIGDAALMIFKSDPSGRHAERAILCAIDILPRIRGLGLDVGMGIESGILSGRYVREQETKVWSSFGEPINAAQRLQEISREMQVPIAIGQGAASQVAQPSKLQYFGSQTLRGFSSPVVIYTVGEKETNINMDELTANLPNHGDRFESETTVPEGTGSYVITPSDGATGTWEVEPHIGPGGGTNYAVRLETEKGKVHIKSVELGAPGVVEGSVVGRRYRLASGSRRVSAIGTAFEANIFRHNITNQKRLIIKCIEGEVAIWDIADEGKDLVVVQAGSTVNVAYANNKPPQVAKIHKLLVFAGIMAASLLFGYLGAKFIPGVAQPVPAPIIPPNGSNVGANPTWAKEGDGSYIVTPLSYSSQQKAVWKHVNIQRPSYPVNYATELTNGRMRYHTVDQASDLTVMGTGMLPQRRFRMSNGKRRVSAAGSIFIVEVNESNKMMIVEVLKNKVIYTRADGTEKEILAGQTHKVDLGSSTE